MNMFRVIAAMLALSMSLVSVPASAANTNVSGDPVYEVEAPGAYAMVADLVVARPLLLAATVIGAGLFVVALPFSALSGSVDRAGQKLVIEPGRATFLRCLGCTNEGYNVDDD